MTNASFIVPLAARALEVCIRRDGASYRQRYWGTHVVWPNEAWRRARAECIEERRCAFRVMAHCGCRITDAPRRFSFKHSTNWLECCGSRCVGLCFEFCEAPAANRRTVLRGLLAGDCELPKPQATDPICAVGGKYTYIGTCSAV